jgi:hypothetical protein
MNADEKAQFEAEFKRKFEEELAKALNTEKELPISEVTDAGVPGTKISCDVIGTIPQDKLLVFGKENIERIRKIESELRYPPIYFSSLYECSDLNKRYGINEEGMYLLRKGEKLEKWSDDKTKKTTPRSEFMATCLRDKAKGETAPERMKKCSEEWKLKK